MRWLTDEEFASVTTHMEAPATQKLVVMSFSAQQQVAAPAAPQIEGARPKATVKKKAAEVVEDAGDDEPEVRKETAPTNAVPKKSGIAATVDAWDTDD
jgi:hypothetical protein